MRKEKYIEEKELSYQPQAIDPREMMKLLGLLKNVCKIFCTDSGYGTGFFCRIPTGWGSYLPVLLTNYHVLKKNDIQPDKIIKFTIEDTDVKEYNILIDNTRKTYSDKTSDVTIIEIRENDNINERSFFSLDEQIFQENSDKIFRNCQIYMVHYPKGKEIKISPGVIKNITEDEDCKTIHHLCDTSSGSSGGPIINKSNFQIIGIHKGAAEGGKNYNLGTFLKEPIEKFNQEIKMKKNQKNIQIKENDNYNKDYRKLNNDSNKDEIALKDNDNKFNNIIYYDYYDSNKNLFTWFRPKNSDSIMKDSDNLERETNGAFILCTNMESFKLIREEILNEIVKEKKMIFNLITTGNQCDNVMNFLNEDKNFKNCIKNICVFCSDKKKWGKLKNKYDLVYDVVDSQKDVIYFINHFSSEEIKPYKITKTITLNEYLEKYKDRHKKISQYYGDLTPKTYKENIAKMITLIIEEYKEKKLYNKDQNELLEGFLTFDLTKDSPNLDNLIIKEYLKNTFYGDLNKWLLNINFNVNSFEVVGYFVARLMYSINNYAKKASQYYNSDRTDLYRGMKLSYSSLLSYERAKGKIIVFSCFTSTSEEYEIAEKFSGRKDHSSIEREPLTQKVSLIIKKKDFQLL